jgi:hypothetical protein
LVKYATTGREKRITFLQPEQNQIKKVEISIIGKMNNIFYVIQSPGNGYKNIEEC